jgi:hypothetical protein
MSQFSSMGAGSGFGSLASGSVTYTPQKIVCHQCKKHIAVEGAFIPLNLAVSTVSTTGPYHSARYCVDCAGFNPESKLFETREDWIRDTVPFDRDTPACIIADYLYEQSRYKDSEYMRGRS